MASCGQSSGSRKEWNKRLYSCKMCDILDDCSLATIYEYCYISYITEDRNCNKKSTFALKYYLYRGLRDLMGIR